MYSSLFWIVTLMLAPSSTSWHSIPLPGTTLKNLSISYSNFIGSTFLIISNSLYLYKSLVFKSSIVSSVLLICFQTTGCKSSIKGELLRIAYPRITPKKTKYSLF
jgi:hypothetical protein